MTSPTVCFIVIRAIVILSLKMYTSVTLHSRQTTHVILSTVVGTTSYHSETNAVRPVEIAVGSCSASHLPPPTSPLTQLPFLSSSEDPIRCGLGIGSCDDGTCCSQNGFCSVGSNSCGTGCQSQYGLCESKVVVKTLTTQDVRQLRTMQVRGAKRPVKSGFCSYF